jgi:hypothetical protein
MRLLVKSTSHFFPFIHIVSHQKIDHTSATVGSHNTMIVEKVAIKGRAIRQCRGTEMGRTKLGVCKSGSIYAAGPIPKTSREK